MSVFQTPQDIIHFDPAGFVDCICRGVSAIGGKNRLFQRRLVFDV